MLAGRSDNKAVRKLFGDSIKGTADLSFIALGIGAAVGMLLGMVPLPIPGVPAEKNVKGLSFAVANVTGIVAKILADDPTADAVGAVTRAFAKGT